jgi:DNA processing protein
MLASQQELGHWLRLTLTPGIGNETARRLLATFGPPENLWQQSPTDLRQVVSANQSQALQREPLGWDALLEATWGWLQDKPTERAIVTLGDSDYPAALLDTADPPLMLYAIGQTAHLRQLRAHHAVAMVGSRNPTPQGSLNAREFARSMASCGLTVVSGLALGIDGAAHEGALQGAAPGQLATIAVVGTGLDRVYPKQHLALAHSIAAQGLILSEYPLGTPPLNANFPKRNRLISGLSQATLVVEAALQSGSLITAKQALEQGRDVFAIPGSIHSPQSKGSHALIKQGAKLVESAQDVLEELRWPDAPVQSLQHPTVTAPADQGLLAQMGHDPIGLDALQARCGLPTADLQAQLLELELAGQVARLPGGAFQRLNKQ